jgi:hypothetical protein
MKTIYSASQENQLKRTVLFYSRDYQASLFPLLQFANYNSAHVTNTNHEACVVSSLGGKVIGCIENDYHKLSQANLRFPYLKYGFTSDRYLNKYPQEVLITVLRKLATFWGTILDSCKPVAVFNEPVAILSSEVLMIEAQKRNIPYIALAYWSKTQFYFYDYPDTYNQSKSSIDSSYISDSELQNSLSVLTKLNTDLKPHYVEKTSNPFFLPQQLSLNLKRFAYQSFRPKQCKDSIVYDLCIGNSKYIYLKQLTCIARALMPTKKYSNITSLSELDKRFNICLYPLHYEPESLLLYNTFFWSNQVSTIETIAKCLPENWILAVKEHPQQPGFLLTSTYSRLKSRLPNLIFLKSNPRFELYSKHISLVITLGGTMGRESLAQQVPVITLGPIYYENFPGVRKAESPQDLHTLFKSSSFNKFLESTHCNQFKCKVALQFANFLKRLYNGNPFPGGHLHETQNIQLLSSAFEHEVERRSAASTAE